MQDKATPWAVFTTFILLVFYGVWAWHDRQADPARLPFEPLITAIATIFALIGFFLYQQKEHKNQLESSNARKPLLLDDKDKELVRNHLQEAQLPEALKILIEISGASDLVIEQSARWNAAHEAYIGGRAGLEEYMRIQNQVIHAILQTLDEIGHAVAPLPNPHLTFRPQYAIFRFLFRHFKALDRSKGYFKPLTNAIFSKNTLLNTFGKYDAHNVIELPQISEIAKEVRTNPPQRIHQMLTKDVFSYFLKGILSVKKQYFVLVLADSGIGKTTFLQKLFYDYARTYPSVSLAFVYAGENTLAELRSIAKPAETILFLDALDEDDGIRQNLSVQLHTLSDSLQAFKKVIITGRTQLFTDEKAWDRLSGKLHFLQIRLQSPYNTQPKAERYLQRNFPQQQVAVLKLYRANPRFFNNPLLLSWFDVLAEGQQATGIKYDGLFEVYETIVEKIARRESDVAERDAHQGGAYPEKLQKFSKGIALDLYRRE